MDNKKHHQTNDHQRISQNIQEELDDAFKTKGNTDENECYTTSETNTINFIKADGQQQMFPYSQLITAWTEHTDEENIIKIFFSTHLVTIKGYSLDKLYREFSKLSITNINGIDKRYYKDFEESIPFVYLIEINWKKNNDFPLNI